MKRVYNTIENLAKNNICGYYVEVKSEVVPMIAKLLNYKDTVAVANSICLFKCGVIDYLRSGKYNFLDHYKPGLSTEKLQDIFMDTFSADAYICSSNAITESGELYNIDGNTNRVAAICYGPKSVIIIVGWNKLVKDIDEVIMREKNIGYYKGITHVKSSEKYLPVNGYNIQGSDERINHNYVVSAYQRHKNRIKVIIVGENL